MAGEKLGNDQSVRDGRENHWFTLENYNDDGDGKMRSMQEG